MGPGNPAGGRTLLQECPPNVPFGAALDRGASSGEEGCAEIAPLLVHDAPASGKDPCRVLPFDPGGRARSGQAPLLLGTEGLRDEPLLGEAPLELGGTALSPVVAATLAEQAGTDQDSLTTHATSVP